MHYFDFLFAFIQQFDYLGYWLFGILSALESLPFVGTILPGATIISIGGLMASQEYFNVYLIGIYSAIGAVIGDYFAYYLGTKGESFVKRFVPEQYLEKGRQFFDKYGNKSVFIGRFIGPLRAVVPFIAGISKMKPRPFLFWNILSSICWATLHVVIGYFSGSVLGLLLKNWSHRLSRITIALLLAILIVWVLKKKKIIPDGFLLRWPKIFVDRIIFPVIDYLSHHFILTAEYFNIKENTQRFIFIAHLISTVVSIYIIAELMDLISVYFGLDF